MKDLAAQLATTMKQRHWNERYQKLLTQALKDPEVQQFLQDHQLQNNQNAVLAGSAAIYEFVQAKKTLTLATGYQPRLLWVNQAIHVSYEPDAAELRRQQKVVFQQKFKTLAMASDVRQADLDDYARGVNERQASYMAAVRFVIDYAKAPKTFLPGLYLSGPFGVGKTYLLSAIAKELVQQQVEVLLVHFPTLAVQMKNAINDNSVLTKIDQIKAVPILMLDDIGADALSSWVRDEVLGVILQYRLQEKLPTFFSSNFSMKDLEAHLTVNQRGDQEPIKAARIMERIRFLAREVVVSGPDRRFN
ncbi:primosomal protein DnaI [Lactobacillus sp. DCY120]|uniref:Primosomal protein DnaI n=1 Tax=Bombilactobacillus apium TaxID=2675299 RepID=A0A850R1U3_9LACO|nr:primosomal protein DnaI [Bombilactobacillus apium]NVY96893.1 primosomal protein DnaI [Bombilactobacillus apium]